MTVPNEDIERVIEGFFEENFQALRMEYGRTISPEAKATALRQVLLYWRKLREVALAVTDTEVRLNLPEQESPSCRVFGIEGIVDIVRENERTIMYDIKTHDAEIVGHHLEAYERQLNVYAHIWHNLRGQPLDEMAVISTHFPEALRDALDAGNEKAVEREMEAWKPVIPIPFEEGRVEEMIRDFGSVVDCIEDGKYEPATVGTLNSRLPGSTGLFARDVCRNCDSRFSCSSYRSYAFDAGGAAMRGFREYYSDLGTDAQRDGWVMAALDEAEAEGVLAELE